MLTPTRLIVRLQNRPKVFCIGFNKTGTTSLHQYFRAAGLHSYHGTEWPAPSQIATAKGYFHRAQCFSDGERSDFVRLQRWFPNALFILNTREERSWLLSRVKHVMRRNTVPDRAKLMERRDQSVMARDFFFNPEAAVGKWILERRIYEEQARSYFAGQPRFLELDVTRDQDWPQKLRAHLLAGGIAHPPVPQAIHSNKRNDAALVHQADLEEYTALVDRWLAETGRLAG